MNTIQSILATAIATILSVLGYAIFLGLPVMFLWNYLAPILKLSPLTFFQALALLLLTGFLFRRS